MKKKFLSSLSLFLAVAIISGTSTTALANNYIPSRQEISALLPLEKEMELAELAREFNLSQSDVSELRELYNQNSSVIVSRGKLGTIVKVAKAVLVKAGKLFGVKLKEKSFFGLVDYLTGWMGNLEAGIESFLINEWDWNETAAEWTAKTIMFVAF